MDIRTGLESIEGAHGRCRWQCPSSATQLPTKVSALPAAGAHKETKEGRENLCLNSQRRPMSSVHSDVDLPGLADPGVPRQQVVQGARGYPPSTKLHRRSRTATRRVETQIRMLHFFI